MDHFLLQNWLPWYHTVATLWANGGWQAITQTCVVCNADGNLPRDAGNVATGAGAGAAAASNGFKDLWGVSTPTTPATSGGDAVRNTIGDFFNQAMDGVFGGGADHSTAPSSSPTSAPSPSTSPGTTNLADLLSADQGGNAGSTGTASPRPSLADFLPSDSSGGKQP